MITFHKPSENTEKKFFSSLYLMAYATMQVRLLLIIQVFIPSCIGLNTRLFCDPTCGHCSFCDTGS